MTTNEITVGELRKHIRLAKRVYVDVHTAHDSITVQVTKASLLETMRGLSASGGTGLYVSAHDNGDTFIHAAH